MSCGDPHDVDCMEIIERVYLYLDGEIDDAARVAVRTHLDECGPCLRRFGLEQEVKTLVARCCGSDSAPDHLRERVLTKLTQIRIDAASVEYLPPA